MLELTNLSKSFGLDWSNHTWMAAYFGEYIYRHWSLPVVINSDRLVGMAQPLFYGYLVYPFVGLISIVTGANLATRLVCAAAFLFQGHELFKTTILIARSRFLAFGIVALVSFSTYPLTNLYNRAAITEFLGVCLLVSACCMWLRLIFDPEQGERDRLALKLCLAFTLAAGIHPITSVLGSMALAFTAVLTLPLLQAPRRVLRHLVAGAIAFAVVLLPWIYTTTKYANDTYVGRVHPLVYEPTNHDYWLMRFWPIARDIRVDTMPIKEISTVYLDGQINVSLLILTLLLGFLASRYARERKGLLIAAAGSFAGFIAVTLASFLRSALPLLERYVGFIQFIYRLITYSDLFLLITAMLLIGAVVPIFDRVRRAVTICLALCIALSTVSVIVKLQHARVSLVPGVVPGSELGGDRGALANSPIGFYAAYDFTIPKAFLPESYEPALPRRPLKFDVGTREHFGEVQSAKADEPMQSMMVLNAAPFPWVRILVNGIELGPDRLFVVGEPGLSTLGVVAPPGRSVIEFRVAVDQVWLWLRRISLLCLAAWIAWLAVPTVHRVLRRS
jgi:hypothetical protein